MAKFLVTGGAGFIGSHIIKRLIEGQHQPTVLDNFSAGHRAAVRQCRVIEGDLNDRAFLKDVFSEENYDCVIHLAASINVNESVIDPLKYYQNNLVNTINLLNAMVRHKTNNIIFSSSAAVYGNPLEIPIVETSPTRPLTPYGRTKLAIENILADYYFAYGLKYIALRYFNAAGADVNGLIGEDHTPETHLIPLVLKVALDQKRQIKVYGTDWATADGTCVRDYIHVLDLADAHVLAAERLLNRDESAVYNLGCERGYSVKEVIDSARKITNHTIPAKNGNKRVGDPPVLVASSARIKADLGWTPQYENIETIIETAWNWHRNHPNGFGS